MKLCVFDPRAHVGVRYASKGGTWDIKSCRGELESDGDVGGDVGGDRGEDVGVGVETFGRWFDDGDWRAYSGVPCPFYTSTKTHTNTSRWH